MTYPFSRIMLATEFTEFDAGAERIAFAMAQRCGISLRVVVPILSNAELEANAPDLALRVEREAAQRIEALRQRAESAGVQLDIHVRRGTSSHEEIVAEAKEAQVDLIVIRRRGKPGFLAKLLVGEMVSKVIRDTSCSVLLVPRMAEFWRSGILAAVGDTPAANSVAKVAGSIAGICGLPLTILSVATDTSALSKTQALNTLALELAGATSDQARGRVVTGDPVEQTIAMVEATAADLVVIGRQRYHLFSFGKTGIMQNIAGAMNVPTLVVPA